MALEKQVSNQQEVQLNEDSSGTTEHNGGVLADNSVADSGGTGQDLALGADPAPVVPPIGHCNLVLVGHTTGYSELSTPLNTIKITESVCVSIVHSLVMYHGLGVIPDDDIQLPPFLRQ